jgi:hypothetical protein
MDAGEAVLVEVAGIDGVQGAVIGAERREVEMARGIEAGDGVE